MEKKIYLAIPYSGLQEESFKVANLVAAQLMQEGHIVFSPISHSHAISEQCNLPTNWEFWLEQDEAFVKWADALYVVILQDTGFDRIKNSVGVQGEILIAKENKTPIRYLFYNESNNKWEIDGNTYNWD